MKNTYIFDLDGTLIDTLESLYVSVNATLEELGFGTITREQCRAFVGSGARMLMARALQSVTEECNEEQIDLSMGVYSRIFAENCTYQVKPYDGIEALLSSLKERGNKIAVLSNKPHEQTVQVVEEYFGSNYFDCIQGQCDQIPRKPDPESIRYVMNQLGVTEEQCVYIGDSEVDMITGEEAGVTTIGVSWGFRDRSVLENRKTAAIIDQPEEFWECI